MARTGIDFWTQRLEAAYRSDPFHAFRKNVDSVRPEEWDVKPAKWSVDEFGTRPELSICDLAMHVGGAMYMYANRAFADDTSPDWGDIALPASREMHVVLEWMDAAYEQLAAGLAALTDDGQLTEMRQAPWRTPMNRQQLLGLVINHALYHSGEVNRQRALMRGAEGWERPV